MGQRIPADDTQISIEIMHCLIKQLMLRKQLHSHDMEMMIATLRQRSSHFPLSCADAAADTLTMWLLDMEDGLADKEKARIAESNTGFSSSVS